jgi:SMI1-KNR4 cell-wall
MWKELIDRLGEGCEFLPPTRPETIREAQGKLSIMFPADLRDLLLEANGIWAPGGNGLIWTVDRIVKDNTEFRTYPDFRTLYMPFDHLLFFGDDGSGDQFAFRILAGAVNDQGVFRWCHETDAREWSAGDMPDYLARALGHDSFFSALR